MTNPYESPQSPPDPTDPVPATGQDVGKKISGFFSALLMTILLGAILGFPLQMVLTGWLPESLKVLAIFLSSPAVTGPVCSVILWLRNRKRNRPFAVGAVTFGVAAFLLIGGCFVVGAALN
jgi:hypothetical protein